MSSSAFKRMIFLLSARTIHSIDDFYSTDNLQAVLEGLSTGSGAMRAYPNRQSFICNQCDRYGSSMSRDYSSTGT